MSTGAYYGWITFLLIFIAVLLYLLIWALLNRGKYQDDNSKPLPLHEDKWIGRNTRARDKVIDGNYKGWAFSSNSIYGFDKNGKWCSVLLCKQTVRSFVFITKREAGRKMLKTLIDTSISRKAFGDIGAFYAYQNAERHIIYYVKIIFTDDKQCVLELSERNYHRLNKLFS